MQHLLVCPMMDTACSPQDLATANGIAIGCAKHWEGTIWQTYGSWWKDKNDDDRIGFTPIHILTLTEKLFVTLILP